ncbi:MAG: hypothetical protein IPJ90_14205 [Anaerolineaceae bacterium]|nr:hypothetical protein [Anaerolineaceae bacterium]
MSATPSGHADVRLILLILAVGHTMIQHVLNSSGNLTLLFVAEQWNSWG